jgi:hypothetical protein
VALALALATIPAPGRAELPPLVAPPSGAVVPAWTVRGDAREEYRARASPSPDESDQDLRLLLDLSGTHASDRIAGLATLFLRWDLDGRSPAGLATIYDTRKPWVDVLALSAEYRDTGALRVARLGRQEAPHGRPGTFDGGYVLAAPGTARLALFAFGGRSVHFFEIGQESFEDWMASAGAVARLGPDLRIELDYRLLREAVDEPDDGERPITDHSYGVSAWYRRGGWLRARMFARGLNASAERLGGTFALFTPGRDAGLDLRLLVQPATLRNIDEVESPYYLTLGRSLPFARWRADVFRLFATRAGLLEAHLGYEGRGLLRDPETAFNRNVSRLFALASAHDLVAKGVFASVWLDRAGARDLIRGQGLWAVSGAAGYERGRFRAEAGTQYHRYQYVYFRSPEEIARVRVFYGEARAGLGPMLWLRARYTHEIFDRVLDTFIVTFGQTYGGGFP